MLGAAEALRQVVQCEQTLALCDGGESRPIRRLAEQIDTDQSAWPQPAFAPHPRDATFQMRGVDLEAARIDIDEHRGRTQDQWHLCRGGVGECRQEHRIPWPDPFRHEGDLDRIGAGAHRHAVPGAAQCRQRGFQFRHLRAEDELAVCQHAVQPPAQFVRDACLLRLQVEKRNGRTRGHGRFTTGISPSLLCSNSVTRRPSRVSARRA